MSVDRFRDVKAILFDLDETLIDAQEGLKSAHRAVAEKICDYLPSCEYLPETLAGKLREFDDRMNLERNYDRDQWWPEFIREVGLEGEFNQAQIEDLTKTYWRTYAEAAEPYPSTQSILRYLSEKGYLLGVVTDTDDSGDPKRERIYPLDFIEMLDVIVVGGEDTENSKPDPEPFERAASELGLTPEECAMVGDKPFTDVRGAKYTGMKTILIKRGDWGVGEEPDRKIKSLDELKEIF